MVDETIVKELEGMAETLEKGHTIEPHEIARMLRRAKEQILEYGRREETLVTLFRI